MAKRLGNDRRVWVKDSGGDYHIIKGNQNLSVSRSGGSFSTATKEDFPYDPQAPGMRGVTIAATFIPDLPDADGWEELMSQMRSSTVATIDIQIRKGAESGADPADVEFECAVYVTQDDSDANQNAAVGSAVSFVAAAKPTVDTL